MPKPAPAPKADRKLPLRERFPNQWCTRSTVYTPMTRIEFEGPLPDYVGELLIAVLAGHRKSEKDPALRRAMKALQNRLLPKAPEKKPAKKA